MDSLFSPSVLDEQVKGRASRGRERDAYFSPLFALDALLERQIVCGFTLLDPCCGDGRMAFALRKRFARITVNDLLLSQFDALTDTPECRIQVLNRDATIAEPPLWGPPCDWVITNPPWNLASEIAQLALRHSKNVALLVRLTFLEATEKRQWLVNRPPQSVVVLPRISFDGTGKTDSCVSAWLVWGRWVAPGLRIVRKTDIRQQVIRFGDSSQVIL